MARLALLLPLTLSVMNSGAALAEPVPMSDTVRIGRPPRPVPIRVEGSADGTRLVVGRGPSASVHRLPVGGATNVAVETVTLDGGGAVAIVRVEGEGRAAALVAGRRRPEVVWVGRIDAHGDPGERRQDVIEVADRTGDGVPDVVVGVRLDATRICGQHTTLLAPRAVDPRTLELRPVTIRRLPEGEDEIELTAVAESPGPEGAPLLDALHFVSASSHAGGPDDPSLAPAPVGLSDGSADTAWREGVGGDGRWEFATARFTAGGHRIRAIALTVAREGVAPHHLWLVGDEGPRLRVTIPEEIARRPGTRAWIVPPTPLSWRCLSVVLDDGWSGGGPGAAPTALADVQAYTDLDFGHGLEALVEEIVIDGERGPEAARLLATLGARAVGALSAAWETLTPTGRRRSLRVFATNARDLAAARDALVRAARDEDPDVRADALAALIETGVPAVDALASLVRDPTAGDEAAVALARIAPDDAVPHLLDAITEAGSERPGLRRALRTAAQRGSDVARERIAAWAGTDPPVAATAAAALALSNAPEARDSATALLRRGVGEAQRFEDRWRLVKAAGHLGPDDAVDGWLAAIARDAEEWMLRSAALEALAARGSARAHEVAREAVEDEYPRVRVAAIEVLGDDADMVEALAAAARRDRWPMVRAAAVDALADDARALPVLRAAVEDHSHAVRAAAVRALITAGDRSSWQRIAARLEDGREWPEVLRAGIEYARTLCVPELAVPLAALLRRGMRPSAWAPDVDVAAEAATALAALGGESADDALERAESDLAPAAIRAAAVQARRTVQRCEP